MLSWNTLTPHYEEDVIYALNSASVAKHFGMEEASARVGGWAWMGGRVGWVCLAGVERVRLWYRAQVLLV